MRPPDIQLLGRDDDPACALFFILDDGRATNTNPWDEGSPANGLAFVVHPSGILATAAHVAWMHDKFPGDSVHVRCVGSSTPFAGYVTILAHGWRGPSRGASGRATRLAIDVLDERTDVVLEDLAFLQLDFDTFEFDERRGSQLATPDTMIEHLRVMPIGAPGYRSLEPAPLTAWCVETHMGAPRLVPAAARFDLHESGLHSAFQVDSPQITFGYSGSPVWDPIRRLAVGFVRSETSRRQKGKARCTDARAIHAAGIPMSWDAELQGMAEAGKALASSYFKRRHEAGAGSETCFVEPAARIAVVTGGIGLTDAEEVSHPALGFIERLLANSPITFLVGAPGAGKSTVLRKLAVRLNNERPQFNGRTCIPLFLNDAELPEKFTLEQVYRHASRRAAEDGTEGTPFSTALLRNDAEVILLIDGLDEVEHRGRQHLLAHFQALLGGPYRVARIVVASRFTQDVIVQVPHHRFPITRVELMAFDASRVEEFARESAGQAKGELFLAALRTVNWQDEASPLQLQMALELFEVDLALPKRESDLVFDYLDSRLKHALAEKEKSPQHNRTDADRAFTLDYSMAVLQALALACHEGIARNDDVAAVLQRFMVIYPQMAQGDVGLDVARLPTWIREELVPKVGLVAIQLGIQGERFQWEHSTFIDVLAAQAKLAITGGDAAKVAALVDASALTMDDRFMVVLICVLDRAKWHQVVATRVEEALQAPLTQKKEGMFALRALAAGVELPEALRRRLVVLLIRLALSPKADEMSCAEFFLPSLPKVKDILRRPDLRNEVLAALWQRFSPRNPRRHGSMAPLVVMKSEAVILDLLDLWNHWIRDGLELVRPDVAKAGSSLFGGAGHPPKRRSAPVDVAPTTLERGGFQVMHRDSTFTQVEMPAQHFLEGIVAMARNLPQTLPPSQVVALYLKGMSEVMDSDTWRRHRT